MGPRTSAQPEIDARIDSCLSMTPLGFPVDPEVYMMTATWVGSTAGCGVEAATDALREACGANKGGSATDLATLGAEAPHGETTVRPEDLPGMTPLAAKVHIRRVVDELDTSALDDADADAARAAARGDLMAVLRSPSVWKSNLQPDFNVRVCECFNATFSASLRELDESNRSVQKSAESTSI